MTTVALTAHFDGEKVQFDEPCRLDTNARLMVVVCHPRTNTTPGRAFQPPSWRRPTATPNRNTPRLISAHERGRPRVGPVAQADGQIKNRPVVLLRRLPPFGDFLVCGISTQLHQRVTGFDEEIAAGDSSRSSPQRTQGGIADPVRLSRSAPGFCPSRKNRYAVIYTPPSPAGQPVPPSQFAGTARHEEVANRTPHSALRFQRVGVPPGLVVCGQ